MQHFGKFLEVLNSKKKTLNMCMIYSSVYERVISYISLKQCYVTFGSGYPIHFTHSENTQVILRYPYVF